MPICTYWKTKAMANPWIEFVRAYRAEHGGTWKDCLKAASATYVKKAKAAEPAAEKQVNGLTWIEFVREYQKKTGDTWKECLKGASPSWRQSFARSCAVRTEAAPVAPVPVAAVAPKAVPVVAAALWPVTTARALLGRPLCGLMGKAWRRLSVGKACPPPYTRWAAAAGRAGIG